MQDVNFTIHDEQEYVLVNNVLHVPRLGIIETAKEVFAAEASGIVMREQNIRHNENTIEMTLDAVGSPDSVYFRDSDILSTELGADEVIVRVTEVGFNFRDLLLILGSLSWHALDFEGAGVMVRVGTHVKDLHVGDRVFYVVNEGGMTNFVRMSRVRAYRILDGLTTVDAASLPIVFSTAIMVVFAKIKLCLSGSSWRGLHHNCSTSRRPDICHRRLDREKRICCENLWHRDRLYILESEFRL